MANSLFRRKTIDSILTDAEKGDTEVHAHGLKRVLTVRDLTFFGIAAIIGAGSFSSLGQAVFNGGPGVVLLFVITGIACAFTALCYSEFASRIPVAGSAYTYAYASFGELFAWIIGWALIMEYSIGNIYVAFSWSDYFTSFLHKVNLHIPDYLTCSYAEAHKAVLGGSSNEELINAWNSAPMLGSLRVILDLPAIVINLLITYLVYRGIKESRNFSNVMVILKLAIVVLVILVGGSLILSHGLTFNWTPANDEGVRSFMPNGFSGVMTAVAGVFFAYIGFDAVSVLAEESKNPQRDLPLGIIASLLICTALYILVAGVLTGMVPWRDVNIEAPIARAFQDRGLSLASHIITLGALAGLTSVMLVMLLGQTRVLYSMACDGLLPKRVFAEIHPKWRTPWKNTFMVGLLAAVVGSVTPIDDIGKMVNIGTLLAFVIVCIAVMVLRKTNPAQARPFRTPWVPLVPILGILFNGFMMYKLGWINWARLVIWLIIGLVVYFTYSVKHSKVQALETGAGSAPTMADRAAISDPNSAAASKYCRAT
jgi:APA family basic amino acid/polyamine antiporter